MEEALVSLKKNGWNLSLEKIKKQFQDFESEAGNEEKRFLRDPEKWIIDEDLKNLAIPSLPDGVNSGKVTQISTPIVLQIKAVEIISAPKQNVDSEAAPRMLKVALSDGKTICYGIEFEHISKISLATPPGTKIRLNREVKLWNGFILLDAKNLQFMGGEVPDLIEEWKVQQLLLGHVRSQDQDGPPPWVPFGRRIQPLNIVDGQDKKTLEEKEKVVKDEEFLSQRQDAIAAAADASGVTKVIKGSGRQLEMQQTERRGRGRERRERNSYRDEERSAKPRDSIRLFEFLQPQIGETPKEEDNAAYSDEEDYVGLDEAEENRPSWERDGVYRRPGYGVSGSGEQSYSRGRGSYQDRNDQQNGRGRRGSYRGQGGSYIQDDPYRERRDSHRGRGSSNQDDSYRDRKESHRGRGGSNYDDSYRDRRESHRSRGSHQEDWRGVSAGTSSRGGGNSHFDQEQSYGGRGRSYHDRRGSSRGGRGGRGSRGSHRDIEDSYSNQRSYSRDYPSSRSPVDALVDDFKAWPGLEAKPTATQISTQVEVRTAAPPKSQEQWAVDDFCLAKWESSDKHYPAVIQQLHPARKSATVMFVESGALRIVENKYLRRDPQDEGPTITNRPRGGQATRIYTPRNRGAHGGGGW
ncbi:tudor domain-containing protein 3-like isoform X2 [Daphnia pulex]|uniref:tudor domain-containing protein 3-like isoform X2 n=1 Tax=Daphnia pulex TaxID=6669 RepID=UPI001EDE9B26|nr:tudor domain-containing protein 3-like isoform X2 [Daphnia pulex]